MNAALTKGQPRWMGPWPVTAAALVVRLATVAWAAGRFPPAGDGQFYDVVARRIARGLGYTWLWPDQTVTFAAHYPVGYPALVGALYAAVGAHPFVAMLLNAVLGAAAVYAVHRVLGTAGSASSTASTSTTRWTSSPSTSSAASSGHCWSRSTPLSWRTRQRS